ncbi:hypothetical protein RHAA1_07526 [Aggregatibacter actinomycetemcomitans RhAA1]|nr:hypothetical protein RHAA1_07526 [Aggregatibacter actinomycetemcomitans RhAA1]
MILICNHPLWGGMYPPFLYSIFEQVHPQKTPPKTTALSLTTLQPPNIRYKLEQYK